MKIFVNITDTFDISEIIYSYLDWFHPYGDVCDSKSYGRRYIGNPESIMVKLPVVNDQNIKGYQYRNVASRTASQVKMHGLYDNTDNLV